LYFLHLILVIKIFNGALPDTLVWNNKLSRNDYAETYFRSPEFDYYPVVGVSWQQASRYCDWLQIEPMNLNYEARVINKDYYANDANNQGANAFNLDKYKANDPELESYVNKQRFNKNLVSELLMQEYKQQTEMQLLV
jgi:formylglycine-generating enzyme required for sulfatase activity